MTMKLRFLENRNPVTGHLEAAAAGRDQLDIRIRPFLRELSRQPGSSGLVVSKRAVFDRDLHRVTVVEELMLMRSGRVEQVTC